MEIKLVGNNDIISNIYISIYDKQLYMVLRTHMI